MCVNIAGQWSRRLGEFIPGFISQHPILSKFSGRMSLILHGSTTMGVDDAFSDIDIWLLVDDASLAEFDAASPTRFIEFELDGKKGHCNATSVAKFADRLNRCEMDLIFQLRNAVILADCDGRTTRLQELARRPMRKEVRDALFFWHYTEMRGEHRACDTPMDRVDPPALLLSLAKAIRHALQAAVVLDGQPYPYDKWLYKAAQLFPTGRGISASVDKILDLLGQGQLRFEGGERQHPISLELRAIRAVLIDAARAKGIEEPWLAKWWLYMDQAREAFRQIRWNAGD